MKLINAEKITDKMIIEFLGAKYASCAEDVRDMIESIRAISPPDVCCGKCKHVIEMDNGKLMCKHKINETEYADFCDCCEYWDME